MATSKVKVANYALQKLGSPKRLESLTQDHPHARTINAAFDSVLDRQLRQYDWSFAIARDSIAADGDGPPWGDWNRYSKPNDFVRLLRDDESGQRVDFKVEGEFILSKNAAPLEIKYIARIDDPNKWDALFLEAYACALAVQCCKEVTGSNELKADLKDDYNTAISEAKRWGAIEKDAQDAPEDDWLNARL